MKNLLLCGAAGMILTGCSDAMIETREVQKDQIAPESTGIASGISGVPYYLPRTMVPATITGAFVQVTKPPQDTEDDGRYSEYVLAVTVGDPVQKPDPDHVYMATINTVGGADDHIKVGSNLKGLLESADATSEDKTDDILVKVAQTVGETIQAVTVSGKAPVKAPVPKPSGEENRRIACKTYLRPFTLKWDLAASDALKGLTPDKEGLWQGLPEMPALNAAILKAMLGTAAAQQPVTKATFIATAVKPYKTHTCDNGNSNAAAAIYADGLRFRIPRPVDFQLNLTAENFSVGVAGGAPGVCTLIDQPVSIPSQPIVVADPTEEFVEDMSRSPLVKKQITLTVNDGVLQDVVKDKPSTILAAVSLPLDLLTALLQPIGSLFHQNFQTPTAPSGTTGSGSSGSGSSGSGSSGSHASGGTGSSGGSGSGSGS